ncbi:unnamed protein product, partial [Ixodes pacificus]
SLLAPSSFLESLSLRGLSLSSFRAVLESTPRLTGLLPPPLLLLPPPLPLPRWLVVRDVSERLFRPTGRIEGPGLESGTKSMPSLPPTYLCSTGVGAGQTSGSRGVSQASGSSAPSS